MSGLNVLDCLDAKGKHARLAEFDHLGA